MAQVQGSPPWSDLLPELLGLVFLRLPKRTDRAFFTAVCRTWCSAARQCRLPPPSPVPWLVVPDGSATSFPRGETFQLPDGVRYHTSGGEGLLLSCSDGSCFLTNQFTKDTVPLPNLSSYSYYQEPVEVGEDIYLQKVDIWMRYKDTCGISVLSLVVCSKRLVAAILGVGGLGRIALCRPGAASWSVSAHTRCMLLSSALVFFQGKLYAIENNLITGEHLIAIDIVDENDSDEPKVSRIGRLKIEGAFLTFGIHSRCMRYLVESHGKLLMILREYSNKRDGIVVAGSNECQVFEADFEPRLWAEVRTLGNSQALFVGKRYSRAVHVSPYDVSRDCIFFVDDYPSLDRKQTTESCGVYDMKDEKVYSLLPMVSWKREEVPATWIFSQGEADKLETEVEY